MLFNVINAVLVNFETIRYVFLATILAQFWGIFGTFYPLSQTNIVHVTSNFSRNCSLWRYIRGVKSWWSNNICKDDTLLKRNVLNQTWSKLFLASFWQFLHPTSGKWGPNTLKFREIILLNEFYMLPKNHDRGTFFPLLALLAKNDFHKTCKFSSQIYPLKWRHSKSLMPKLAFRILSWNNNWFCCGDLGEC